MYVTWAGSSKGFVMVELYLCRVVIRFWVLQPCPSAHAWLSDYVFFTIKFCAEDRRPWPDDDYIQPPVTSNYLKLTNLGPFEWSWNCVGSRAQNIEG